ncbi:ABC transporter substrate-binding protein [Acuticoccus mangrovi]|uniref:Extracellular solute-binding protein n=1 Tax=Acuticoccus mangrovi TaxID=2796142 RepID=A0A934IP15_9HYPH|nr:extracellular solute-binding protein [Acuticoccus mangrovi]MBJ3776001.1 extracellular solute-binding protein [Acuticoccus mangrovi]
MMTRFLTGATRRAVLGALAALPLVASALPASADTDEIYVQIWGTTWQSALQDIAERFEDATGIAVVPVTQASSSEGLVRLQSAGEDPEIDVWFTTSSLAARATQNDDLFLDLPESVTELAPDLVAGAIAPRYAAAYFYPMSVIYRTDMVDAPITTWKDLWDARFANSLAVPDVTTYAGRSLLISAIANGGSIDDIDPGFEGLKALSPNVVMFYSSDATARQALAQGEVSTLVATPAQAKRMRDQGIEVEVATPAPTPMLFDVMTLVDTPRADAAAKFIAYVLSPESQKLISERLNQFPVRKDTPVAEALQSIKPDPENTISFDEAKVNANIGEWNERFQREVAQ